MPNRARGPRSRCLRRRRGLPGQRQLDPRLLRGRLALAATALALALGVVVVDGLLQERVLHPHTPRRPPRACSFAPEPWCHEGQNARGARAAGMPQVGE
eukprot:8087693-Alexandrium_andersonii.AAC.1